MLGESSSFLRLYSIREFPCLGLGNRFLRSFVAAIAVAVSSFVFRALSMLFWSASFSRCSHMPLPLPAGKRGSPMGSWCSQATFRGQGQTLLGLVCLVPLGGGPRDYGSHCCWPCSWNGPTACAYLWNRVWVTCWGFRAATHMDQTADATRFPDGGQH